MKIIRLRLLVPVLLAVVIATPAYPQSAGSATKFNGFLCEIDLKELDPQVIPPLPFVLPEGGSVFTFNSRKTCAGTASARNAKIECESTIPGWKKTVDVSARGFECTINGDTCDLKLTNGDPIITTTITSLTVSTKGKAKLTCFYKP